MLWLLAGLQFKLVTQAQAGSFQMGTVFAGHRLQRQLPMLSGCAMLCSAPVLLKLMNAGLNVYPTMLCRYGM